MQQSFFLCGHWSGLTLAPLYLLRMEPVSHVERQVDSLSVPTPTMATGLCKVSDPSLASPRSRFVVALKKKTYFAGPKRWLRAGLGHGLLSRHQALTSLPGGKRN